jgi:hypothetical protein
LFIKFKDKVCDLRFSNIDQAVENFKDLVSGITQKE